MIIPQVPPVSKWVVLRWLYKKNGYNYWLCRCVCGREQSIRQDNLTSGRSTNCGCLKWVDRPPSGQIDGVGSETAKVGSETQEISTILRIIEETLPDSTDVVTVTPLSATAAELARVDQQILTTFDRTEIIYYGKCTHGLLRDASDTVDRFCTRCTNCTHTSILMPKVSGAAASVTGDSLKTKGDPEWEKTLKDEGLGMNRGVAGGGVIEEIVVSEESERELPAKPKPKRNVERDYNGEDKDND